MECPVCWESLAAESMVTVSIPCGHLFHEKCLYACIQQQVHPTDGTTQSSQPDCPTCRKPLNLPPTSIWDRVPKELRLYFHPVIRRVYLNGVVIEPEEEMEMQKLHERLDASEEACRTTECAMRDLRSRLLQEQGRSSELERDLNNALQRERTAVTDAERWKQEAQRGLQRMTGSGDMSPAFPGICSDNFGFNFGASPPPQQYTRSSPSYCLPPPLSSAQPLQPRNTPLVPNTSSAITTATHMVHSFTRPKSYLEPSSISPLSTGPSSSTTGYGTLSFEPRHPDSAHDFDGLFVPVPPLPSNSQPPLPSGSTCPHPSLASPRDWSHLQREKRFADARTQSVQQTRLLAMMQRRPPPPSQAPFPLLNSSGQAVGQPSVPPSSMSFPFM